eukprot:7326654-Ditylum_brightwellii.AAC.1
MLVVYQKTATCHHCGGREQRDLKGDEGKGSESDEFRLVSSSSLRQAGVISKYTQEDTNNMRGMQVKLALIFLAMGCHAPIFILVCGLTEHKFPPEPCVVVEIEGLCIGEGGVGVGNKQKKYVMFMQGENGADIKKYKYYRDKVLLPFIQTSRESMMCISSTQAMQR